MTLTFAAIVALMLQVGFPQYTTNTGAAVALAESRGYTYAYNGVDRGLWQISRRWHPEVSDWCAYDAVCSTQAALRISNWGRNWRPWSTYNSGAYRWFLR